ncbi:MAG: holo-ACP synthase [Acidimicrobiales bacterium]|nr:holo-ACP synthase [Acidimicrobiales bacterium]
MSLRTIGAQAQRRHKRADRYSRVHGSVGDDRRCLCQQPSRRVIGLGVDLVEVDRMRTVLERTPTLVDRLFTEYERAYARSANDPTQRLAVRFAAKEAAMKALGVGLGAIGWHDIEVRQSSTGAPELAVSGRAGKLADELGITEWKVSLTHTRTVAEAVVAAL